MQRVLVIGMTGSGKSTLAKALAESLKLPYVELDAIHHLPGWKEIPREEFRTRAAEIAQGEKWVMDGNYVNRAGDITWPLADTVIWLDMPFFANFARLVARTLRRWRTQETICNGNRESLLKTFFTKHSLLWWFLKTRHRTRRKYAEAFAHPEQYPHLKMIRLRTYAESRAFIDGLKAK